MILREIGQPLAAQYLGVSAVVALPTVILAFFYGQSRIFFVMARDGLLPQSLARVSGRGSPIRITIFTAIVVAVLAGLIPLAELAALANAGTLTAFIAVAVCMLVMRRRAPDAERLFRTPFAWPVGMFGILGCLYLIYSLPQRTQIWFLGAHVVGIVIYLLYGARRSVAGRAEPDECFERIAPACPALARRAGSLPDAGALTGPGDGPGAAAHQRRRHPGRARDPARADHRRQLPPLCRHAPARRDGILPRHAHRARCRADPGRRAQRAPAVPADRARADVADRPRP